MSMNYECVTLSMNFCVCDYVSASPCPHLCICICVWVWVFASATLRLRLCVFVSVFASLYLHICVYVPYPASLYICVCVSSAPLRLRLLFYVLICVSQFEVNILKSLLAIHLVLFSPNYRDFTVCWRHQRIWWNRYEKRYVKK